MEELKLVEVNRIEEQKVEKILNRRKVRKVMKYLVCWKRFTIKNDRWEKKEDLENSKKLVEEFKGKNRSKSQIIGGAE